MQLASSSTSVLVSGPQTSFHYSITLGILYYLERTKHLRTRDYIRPVNMPFQTFKTVCESSDVGTGDSS